MRFPEAMFQGSRIGKLAAIDNRRMRDRLGCTPDRCKVQRVIVSARGATVRYSAVFGFGIFADRLHSNAKDTCIPVSVRWRRAFSESDPLFPRWTCGGQLCRSDPPSRRDK